MGRRCDRTYANCLDTANSDIDPTLQQHLREDFSEYTKEWVASVHRCMQIKNDPIQLSQVELVLPIVEEFFKAVQDGQQRVGNNYTLRRGEVLRLTGQEVEMAALEDHDVMLMQQAWSRWLERIQLQEQKKPKKCSSKRDQGLEL